MVKVTGIIYCARNSLNGQCYVGQTIQSFQDRQDQHLNSDDTDKFHTALRSQDNDFEWTILKVVPEYELDSAEKYFINYLDSENNGYNSTGGGS